MTHVKTIRADPGTVWASCVTPAQSIVTNYFLQYFIRCLVTVHHCQCVAQVQVCVGAMLMDRHAVRG